MIEAMLREAARIHASLVALNGQAVEFTRNNRLGHTAAEEIRRGSWAAMEALDPAVDLLEALDLVLSERAVQEPEEVAP